MAKTPIKFSIHFQRDPKLSASVTHGVWGGINEQGSIEMNFFSESEDLPECCEKTIDADGNIEAETVVTKSPSERHFTRTIHSRIIVDYDVATSIVNWLSEQLDTLDQIEAANSGSLPPDSGQDDTQLDDFMGTPDTKRRQ